MTLQYDAVEVISGMAVSERLAIEMGLIKNGFFVSKLLCCIVSSRIQHDDGWSVRTKLG